MKTNKKIFLLVLISFFLSSSVFGAHVNASVKAFSDVMRVKENCSTAQGATDAVSSESIGADQTAATSFQDSLTGTIQGGHELLRFSSVHSSASFPRHMMCKDHDMYYRPIEPTTIFRPSDTKAECLTTVSMKKDDTIEFRWYYRSDSSKTWVSCYNWSDRALYDGEHVYAGYLNITGCWPGSHYPRAYKVDVYLDDSLSFSEFFEVTNGGLNSPRMCEEVADEQPVNMKSRFTIGVDTKAHHHLRFEKIAYFNEEFGCCHNFTTVWIQPDGTPYKTHSGSFTDYKDANVTWNYWKHGYIPYDYVSVNSSTPIGNWKVEVYLDSYFNGTWMPYGPVATTPFIIGSEPVADWTFMVYLDADNSLEYPGIDVFLKTASVGSSSQINIVVQMDRIPNQDSRYGNWTDCKRFNVTKGMTPTPGNATVHLGEVNMGHPDTLRDFVNWTMNDYPANYYFLVLWNHGIGCMGVCFDVTDAADALSLPEISQALDGLPVIMDVVLIDACSMAMIEVAYQIKDHANVLVGPEGIGYAHAPFDHYLSSLTSNSSMLPSAFAKEVVADYINWCMSIDDVQNATLSATDVTKISSLVAAIDDFAVKLKEKETPYLSLLSASHEQISLARNSAEGYQGPYAEQTGYYIDLYDFAQLTYQFVLDEELRNIADQVMTTLESVVIMDKEKARPRSHGLSIFFPDEKEKYDSFRSMYEETTFSQDTSWDELVKYHLSGYILTIQTPCPNIPLKVNEEPYITDADGRIRVFVLPDYYIINISSLVLAGPGSREVFTQWNDNDTSNPRSLLVKRTSILEAEYVTQYRLIMDTNFGTTQPSLGEHWYEADSTIKISAIAPNTVSDEQYVFLGWTGTGNGSNSSTNNPASITMDGPVNETAVWRHEYHLTIISVYGSPTLTSGWFEAGKIITPSVTSPVSGPTGTRYACIGWTGTGSVLTSGTTASVTFMIDEPSSITWNWKTQYLLTVHTDPTALSPQPEVSPQGPWYDTHTVVNCSTQKISGYLFDHWTVDGINCGRGINSITITMDGPHEATTHYVRSQTWWEILFRPEMLQVILGIIGIMLTAAVVGTTWIRTHRRRSITKTLLNEIDEVYSTLKTDPQKCEEELRKLQSRILEWLTDGKITEESYDIMDKRIDKYIEEIQKITKPR